MRSRPTALDRRCFLALGGALCLAGVAPARATEASPLTGLNGAAFGTHWSISLPAGAGLSGLRLRLDALLAELDLAFSPWRPDSIVARFNAGTARDMSVTEEIAAVTGAALRIAAASGGAFDPTVGPLVARWGFGPIRAGGTRPGGWLKLAAGNGHIARAETDLTLDLCGIAKGHALDRMVALLHDAGHEHFLIEFGGELAARGRHPSGRAWQVGIETPLPGTEEIAGVLRLDGMAVATSGDLVNGYDVGRRRYSHIIDPTTGEPVESALASVSVLTATAREADGWATALMSAGQAGPDLARRLDIAALFLFRDGPGLRSVATGTFRRHFDEAV
ncbi:MAG: FAD:protein FMN transferase [Mesorhizobium sp.]|nr:FAD:protein FMN transferase [Mesorhizobium sp.]